MVLVADEPGTRKPIRMTLEPDCTVLEAGDGDQAWTLLRKHRPPLALLAVRMLGRNGLELIQAIRAQPRLADTVVFLLSTAAQAVDVAAGRGVGADGYIAKPFSPIGLMARVSDAIGLGLRYSQLSDSPRSLIHTGRCSPGRSFADKSWRCRPPRGAARRAALPESPGRRGECLRHDALDLLRQAGLLQHGGRQAPVEER